MWHQQKIWFHLLPPVLILFQNNYSNLSTFSHSYLCMLYTPFSGSTFLYLSHYPLTFHFLKSRIVKRSWWSCLQQKWKQKGVCQQSHWSFHFYFVPFFCIYLLNWKIFRLKTACCKLHTISIIQMITEPREEHLSAESHQNLLVSSCHYVMIKEIADCEGAGLHSPPPPICMTQTITKKGIS